MKQKPDFSGIIKSNPSGFITRENLEEATGGLYKGRLAANHDCRGEGIAGRFKIGRKVAYPVHRVVEFLEQRAISA